MEPHRSYNNPSSSTSDNLSATNQLANITPKEEPVSPPASPNRNYRRGPIIVYGGGLKWNFPVRSDIDSPPVSNGTNNPVTGSTPHSPTQSTSSVPDQNLVPVNAVSSSEATSVPLTKNQKLRLKRKLFLQKRRQIAEETGIICPVEQRYLLKQQLNAEKRAKLFYQKGMEEAIAVQEKLKDVDIKPFAIKQELQGDTEIQDAFQKCNEFLSRAESIAYFALKFNKMRASSDPCNVPPLGPEIDSPKDYLEKVILNKTE
ncbi:uncharacterized protein LOC107370890 isoform X2 [Tetranychus urticae]|uniref:uncharacterized protein LOC107370890 isoform X3 n=1 Tax=Tetranychus urticae TaxID=32264 RepID=UPI00077B868F|nr:uncharacterized protein LOC107370890 isoform X3 [Tetranychus urticae]XP_025018499.1 uncharacterized protein LOC107370890 isoform X2 [Tetranychus urticae]